VADDDRRSMLLRDADRRIHEMGPTMIDCYWVYIDFGADHDVVLSPESPGPEWIGPYSRWNEVQSLLRSVASAEIERIRDIRDGWALRSRVGGR